MNPYLGSIWVLCSLSTKDRGSEFVFEGAVVIRWPEALVDNILGPHAQPLQTGSIGQQGVDLG